VETLAADGNCLVRRSRPFSTTEVIQNNMRLSINNGGNIEVMIIGVYQCLFCICGPSHSTPTIIVDQEICFLNYTTVITTYTAGHWPLSWAS
jgi:hypothetical protein